MVIGVVGTLNLGTNNRLSARAFLTHLRQFPPNSRTCASGGDLRYHSVYSPENLTLNLVRFGVDRTFEIMMYK